MNCPEARPLLDAFLDGELDVVSSLRLEEHLRTCEACRQMRDSRAAIRESLKDSLPRFDLPAKRQERILAVVRAREGQTTPSAIPATLPYQRPFVPLWNSSWQFAALASALLLGIGGAGGSLLTAARLRQSASVIAAATDNDSDLISGHVRSLMAAHIFDVASTNQHTVKPWFAGKLDFAPPVPNLADQGFPLAGGRLDYLDGQPVAALVYRRHQHWINLFIHPASGGDTVAAPRAARGYTICRWTQAGMAFAAISDLNAVEMQEFVRLQQSASRPPQTGK